MIEIFYTQRFQKDLKRLYKKNKQIRQDIDGLVETLRENPRLGTSLGNNLFKIRVKDSSSGKGKSGGYRVITYFLTKNEWLYLMTMYSKTERATISEQEIKVILDSLSPPKKPAKKQN